MSTPAYLRPQPTANPARVRETNQYTYAIRVDEPSVAATALYRVLEAANIVRTSAILEVGRAGVSWRASSDVQARATAALLRYAIAQEQDVEHERLWTGYGIHTRDVAL